MKKVLGIGFLILVALVGVSGFYFWFSGHEKELAAENEKALEAIATNTPATAQKPKEQPVAKLPKYKGQAINTMGDDPIIAKLPISAVEVKKIQLGDLAAVLAKNPNDFDGWMALANFKKFFNNFTGARDAWEYAKLIVPNQPLVYLNLGNLYGYYLHDLKKAEANFLTAISLDSLNVYGGLNSFAGYYKDLGFKDKALEVYKKALEFAPNSVPLKTEIQRLSE